MAEDQQLNIRGFNIKYLTKPGVFAKHGLDEGTELLLNSVEIADNTLIADLGGGAGIISLVAARLNPNGHIHLLDDHLRSIELAKQNVDLNRSRNIEVYLSDLFSAVDTRTYHQILSNPPQQLGNEFLEELVDDCYKHLKHKGELILVVKNNIKPVIERLLKKSFGNYKLVKTGKGHSVIKAVRD